MRSLNALVGVVLRSPARRLLSGVDLVRYSGRRSGRVVTTPTQYARRGDDVVIAVARPESKTWWRNFVEEGALELFLDGRWVPYRARAVRGDREPDVAAALLQTYLDCFPKAAKAFAGTTDEQRLRLAVLVWCRPR